MEPGILVEAIVGLRVVDDACGRALKPDVDTTLSDIHNHNAMNRE
jgi:hypothetical protein